MIADEALADVRQLIPEYNEHYGASLGKIAAVFTGEVASTAAIETIDADRICLRVGDDVVEITLAPPLQDAEDLTNRVIAYLSGARTMFPDAPETPLEAAMNKANQLSMLNGTVIEKHALSNTMISITIDGMDKFQSIGWDQSVTFVIDTPEAPLLYPLTYAKWRSMGSDRPVGRTYTIRRFNPDTGTAEIWLVLHDSHCDEPTVSAWAKTAEVGDEVGIFGPHGHAPDPLNDATLIVAVDESALPAGLTMIEGYSVDGPVAAELLIVVENDDSRFDVTVPEGTAVTWINRSEYDNPDTALVADVTARLETLDTDNVYLWGAGETTEMRELRRACQDAGLDRSRAHIAGYWRAGVSM